MTGNRTRREFLKDTSILATVALAGQSLAQSPDRIRVGVIGVRGRGNEVARAFDESGAYEIRTLCDCDEACYTRAMEKIGSKIKSQPKFEKDFRRVLEDKEIDAVVIATPDHWHGAMALLALDAGKHIYLEKPVSFTIAEGAAMVKASRVRPAQAFVVGSQQRSGPHFVDAREFIKSGGLGKVGFARAWITQNRDVLDIIPDSNPPSGMDYEMWVGPAPMRPYNENLSHYNWRFAMDYGTGETGNWGAHWLDIVRWFLDLDLPTRVMATGGTHVVRDAKQTPDTLTSLFEFDALTVVWEQRIWTESKLNAMSSGAEFQGEKGALFISRDGWGFHPRDGETQSHSGSELMVPHVANFHACITQGATPTASIEDGHKTATMGHLAHISAAVGRAIQFDPLTQSVVGDAEAAARTRREFRAPWNSIKV